MTSPRPANFARWHANPKRRRRWETRDIAWMDTFGCANSFGAEWLEKLLRPIAGQTAPTAARGRDRRLRPFLRDCIGTNGSDQRLTGIFTRTCTRTNGTAGLISATVRSA